MLLRVVDVIGGLVMHSHEVINLSVIIVEFCSALLVGEGDIDSVSPNTFAGEIWLEAFRPFSRRLPFANPGWRSVFEPHLMVHSLWPKVSE